jgi:hypothetical protein
MLNYKEYLKESQDNQVVVLDDGQGGNMFKTVKNGSKNSIAYLNAVIKRFIESVYGSSGFVYGKHTDIFIDNKIINGEYISKMVNNYTIFKNVIRINNIKEEESFYNFMLSNLNNIYSPNGKFFLEQSLPILINTTRRGNVLEKMAKESFLKYSKEKDIEITIQNPSVDEDINGVDFKFLSNGRSFTVQVKPFTDYKYIGDKIFIKTEGSLSLNTNYLILCDGKNCIKLRNTPSNPVKIKGNTFISSKSNLLI